MRQLMVSLAVCAAVCSATAAFAGSAAAAAQGSCDTTKAFAQFGDSADYALFVNGGLEDGSGGFKAIGAPRIVAESEPFALHGQTDGFALELGSGDSAAFHAGCMSRVYPSVRFVARSVGAPTGSLRVEVEYKEAMGVRRRVTVGTLEAADYNGWAPTPVLTFLDPTQAFRDQAHGSFTLILTPAGAGSLWQVDDLYVDPFRGR
ncbi:MAG TPA: hypothetical protein VGJ77_06680 [Gaiellaceae bacterium]|jgi:hypothetical protein